jgi:hypothetical protein
MTDTLRERFDDLVSDGPPLSLSLLEVMGEGRRLRRRRQAWFAAGSVAVLALGAAVTVPLVAGGDGGGEPADTVAVQPFAMTGSGNTPTVDEPAPDLTKRQQAIADAVVASSPDGWTFDFAKDRWDGLGVEATADDGAGPGRLMIGLSLPGYQQLHPCQDPEFQAGVKCVEETLADGSILSMRSVVDWHGVQYADIALTHPDGSGTMAETGNFVIKWPPPAYITLPSEKRDLTQVTRDAPPYTVEQLAKVVVAVDRAMR